MRLLNLISNKLSIMDFTHVLEQRIRDTLCGTKVLSARDYARIASGRSYFWTYDPFCDFDLLLWSGEAEAEDNRSSRQIP